MHVTTFYSFKGGVGRTQALVNVGVELAQRGRRVLLVDFDLEAPGLDTYPLPRPTAEPAGIVDFVTDYIRSGEAPDASLYTYECPGIGEKGGRLWVMPSGRQDADYGLRLSDIDWSRLYTERSGFLLFEDLKLQWKEALNPDYVLIDSRTGHTDVAGICTRQLPDSVVILFFPTDQNLRGLPKVVNDIRAEADSPQKKEISLLFVMSNVPDLDDEDQILESRIRLFTKTLNYDDLAAVIHRYDSMALLNQMIFTADRPKSRLAREYRALTDSLIEQNLNDREGALAFIRKVARRSRRLTAQMPRYSIETRLNQIRKTHESDPAILQQLANLQMRDGRVEEASALWNVLVEQHKPTPHVLLRRAEARVRAGQERGALEDVLTVLQADGPDELQVGEAIGLLAKLAPEQLRSIARTAAVQHLENDRRLWVAHLLAQYDHGLSAAREILTGILAASDAAAIPMGQVRFELAIVLIGLGRFEEARDVIADEASNSSSIGTVFNYAMASWGAEGTPRRAVFERVITLDEDRPGHNYPQCLAVALAIVGRTEEALARVNLARRRLKAHPVPELSCWRYRSVTPDEFMKDLDEIEAFIGGGGNRPRFFDYSVPEVGGSVH